MQDAGQGSQAVSEPVATLSAPIFDWKRKPDLVNRVQVDQWESELEGNFPRSAQWCPDGSAVLTTAEDRILRILDTPDGLLNQSGSSRNVRCPDAVVSTCWYPAASLRTPETFCFVLGVRDTPVRLVDASDGRVRASYPIVDHRERMIASHSIVFSPDASRFYCGCDGAIEVFDVSNPGHDTSERLKLAPTRRSGDSGQRGIISSLAFVPDYSGTYAAGTYTGHVSLYSEDTGATPLQHVGCVKGGGVTQIAFNPANPTLMFVASRRSNFIQVYDTRDCSRPMGELPRAGMTNQRLALHVDPWGRYIASGDTDGHVKIWDCSNLSSDGTVLDEKLCKDSVGSVQIHPFHPLILACSGSRSFASDGNDIAADLSTPTHKSPTTRQSSLSPSSSDEGTDSDSSSAEEETSVSPSIGVRRPYIQRSKDASLSLWSFSPSPESQ